MDVESHSERVERDLDRLVERRDQERRKSEEQRRIEDLWMPSERAHAEREAEEHRAAWIDYERHMRDLHWGLGDEHDRKLRTLENGHYEEKA